MSRDFRILITDDDPESLLLMTTVLRRDGYEVLESKTGRGCLDAMMAYRPALVLLDVKLPDTSGIEVCRQIKASPDLEDTFVILTSGVYVSSERQADGLNAGADGYIIKPISNKELVARVHSIERIKDAEDRLREKEKELEGMVSKLQIALTEIKVLKGLIPICASCKKIRNEEGFWDQLETYFSKHTDALFTHGLCPGCADKYRAKLKATTK